MSVLDEFSGRVPLVTCNRAGVDLVEALVAEIERLRRRLDHAESQASFGFTYGQFGGKGPGPSAVPTKAPPDARATLTEGEAQKETVR